MEANLERIQESITSRSRKSRPALIYRSVLGYELTMMALYGRHYPARYRAIAELVEPGSTVLELCCGPGLLYWRGLRDKSIRYTGFDLNERFVGGLVKKGIRAEVRDLSNAFPLPPNDYVVMQASLYHFLPNPEAVLAGMLSAAKQAVIVSEPIRNLAHSGSAFLRRLSTRLTDAGHGIESSRFDERSLDRTFENMGWRPAVTSLISGGREKIYMFRKAH